MILFCKTSCNSFTHIQNLSLYLCRNVNVMHNILLESKLFSSVLIDMEQSDISQFDLFRFCNYLILKWKDNSYVSYTCGIEWYGLLSVWFSIGENKCDSPYLI